MEEETKEEEIKFEEALAKLEDVVSVLETGDLSLEESLEAFEEGVRLSKICSKWLNEAELRVEKLISFDEDNVETKPFEIPSEG
jgi:exodeoxyribonuclease VII small subunit